MDVELSPCPAKAGYSMLVGYTTYNPDYITLIGYATTWFTYSLSMFLRQRTSGSHANKENTSPDFLF